MDNNRKNSPVWNFFNVVNETKAMCRFCKHELSYKSSITNLKTHLKNKHPSISISNPPNSSAPCSARANTTSNTSIASDDSRKRKEVPDEIEIIDDPDDPASQPQASSSESLARPTPGASVNHSSRTGQSQPPSVKKRPQQTKLSIPRKIGFTQKKDIDDSLLKLITKDFQPLSIVENQGFREYTYALNPNYSLPSRKMISNLLTAKYSEVYDTIGDKFVDAIGVTLTTDCWTSCNTEGFIAVTAHFIDNNFEIQSVLLETESYNEHHTSVNLASELRKIVTKWNLQDKILLAVSDNAANIKKAISEELKWRHFGCLAHTINLIVQDSLKLKNVTIIIEKVKDIVSHFKRSSIAKTKLELYQNQRGAMPKKLIQSVATRWNSVYYMLERFIELKEDVRATLAALGKEEWPMLRNEEFMIIEKLVKVLRPMEMATREMSGEKYVTLSSVIVVVNGLNAVYKEFQEECFQGIQEGHLPEVINDVLLSILEGLKSRLGTLEDSATLLTSTFLDPRFKTVGFTSEYASKRAENLVTNLITNLIDNKKHSGSSRSSNNPDDKADEPNKNELSCWASFDKKALAFQPTGNSRARAIIEVQRYLVEPLLNRTQDPLNWWKINAYNFPYLSQLVREKFGTVATSVPCERVFSKTGQLISDRRNRLSSKRVNEIMFLNGNS